MSATPTAVPADGTLLHCSPTRSVWRRNVPRHGDCAVKVYLSGSPAEAEREFQLGALAQGPGVVTYHGIGTDGPSGRPIVTTAFESGVDLERLVLMRGALPAAEACRLLAPVARTLARLHGLRGAELPHGLCHGDVKPQNLLLTPRGTLLLDFEHAAPAGAGGTRAFTGGSLGFAPPEARHGAAPDAAFDTFGLGATLAWLLAGGGPARVPQHPAIEALLAACCAEDPGRRPDAADAAVRLEALALQLDADPAEAVLQDWASGRMALAGAPPELAADPRCRPWGRRARLLARRPALLRPPASAPAEPAALAAALAATGCVLRRFPRAPAALQRRSELLLDAGRLLHEVPQRLHELAKAEQFSQAAAWLAAAERMVRTALDLPTGAAVGRLVAGAGSGLLQREPLEFLRRLRQQLDDAHAELRELGDRITAAEHRLDVASAEQALETMAARYGGSSSGVSRRRDRLHRLVFYLDRIARAETNVERVESLWDASALQPLHALVAAAAAAEPQRTRGETHGGAVGLRSLQVTLVNLIEEFPSVVSAPPALEVLSQALGHLTDQAWQQLSAAEEQLRAVPVPIRPLQQALGLLETLRLLEALVDRPGRPRSDLIDGIDRLRLGIEQARLTRDRLAESAEHALARGHWTTGLFDMERAVARIQPDDGIEQTDAERLRQRLEQARRRKQEIDAAVRRNVELTARYATLEDDPSSTFEARLRALQDRRDCLLFLGMHVPSERALLYRRDLRGVETQISVELAAAAERRLDAAENPAERLRIARATLEQLAASTSSGDHAGDPPGRVVRLIEHWRTVATQCQRALEQQRAAQQRVARQRRRIWLAALAAVLVTGTAVALGARSWLLGEPAQAAPRSPDGR